MVDLPASDRPQAPRGIFSAVGLAFAGRGGEVLLAAVGNIIVARILGPSGRGNLTTALTASFILYLLCELGLRFTITRLVASGRATWREGIATLAALYASVCVVVLPVCSFLLLWYHAAKFPGVPLAVLYLALYSIPVIMLEGSIASVLAGQQRQPEANILRVVEKGVVIIGYCALVWAVHTGLLGAMIASTASFLVGTLIGLVLLARLPGGRMRVRADLIPEIFRFGLVLYIGNLAMSMNYRLDTLLVYGFLRSADTGLYAIAVQVAEMMRYLPDTASAVLFPSVSGDVVNASERTTRLTRVMTFVLVVSCLGLAVIGYPAIKYIFGDAFIPSYLSMVLLLPGMVTIGLAVVVVSDIAGRGYPQFGAISAWTSLVATILLDFLLIPGKITFAGLHIPGLGWGINGAAIASSVAYTVSFIVLTIAYRRLTGVRLRDMYCPRAAELREMFARLRLALQRRIPRSDSAE